MTLETKITLAFIQISTEKYMVVIINGDNRIQDTKRGGRAEPIFN